MLIAALIISGCVAQNMEHGLNVLLGQGVKCTFAVLGYPHGQQQFGGDTVYTWQVARTMPFYEPQSTYYTGSVGGAPFNASGQGGQWSEIHGQCTVRVVTGPDNIVKNWEYSGNPLGCEEYANRLRRVE